MNIVDIMQWCFSKNLVLSISKGLTYRIRDVNKGLVLVTDSLETLTEYCYDDIRSQELPKSI